MKKLFFVFITAMVVFNSCRNTQRETMLQPVEQPSSLSVEEQLSYRITDYRGRDNNEEFPIWVSLYNNGGVALLESLDENRNTYIFISENSSDNFNALQQWLSGFRLSHHFTWQVTSRIQARFERDSHTFPAQDFGAFFEVAIKSAMNVVYRDAVREADFWLKRQYLEEDGVTVEREVYEFLVMMSIDRNILRQEINHILINAQSVTEQTREQAALIQRFIENFHIGF